MKDPEKAEVPRVTHGCLNLEKKEGYIGFIRPLVVARACFDRADFWLRGGRVTLSWGWVAPITATKPQLPYLPLEVSQNRISPKM